MGKRGVEVVVWEGEILDDLFISSTTLAVQAQSVSLRNQSANQSFRTAVDHALEPINRSPFQISRLFSEVYYRPRDCEKVLPTALTSRPKGFKTASKGMIDKTSKEYNGITDGILGWV